MPAAAVIPALIVYTNVADVKKLVVGFKVELLVPVLLVRSAGPLLTSSSWVAS